MKLFHIMVVMLACAGVSRVEAWPSWLKWGSKSSHEDPTSRLGKAAMEKRPTDKHALERANRTKKLQILRAEQETSDRSKAPGAYRDAIAKKKAREAGGAAASAFSYTAHGAKTAAKAAAKSVQKQPNMRSGEDSDSTVTSVL